MYVKAEKFAQGGRSVGHLPDGRVVFIDGLFPGEEAEIEIIEAKRDYCIAKPLFIAQKSPARRGSSCPFSEDCGGCQWIELSYDSQVQAKDAMLRELFSDVDVPFLDPVTGPEFGYRSRARFQYSIRNGKASLGFCASKSNRNVVISSCKVADRALNELIGNPPRLNAWELKDSELSCISTDDGVLYDDKVKWITVGSGTLPERRLPVSGSVFFQSNLILLPRLIEDVVSLVKGSDVMDLYSGVGTFSAFLEDRYNVTAVEINKACLALARMHLKNTRFFTSPVEKWKAQKTSVDTVIVDPPRVGLERNVPAMIASWKPERIVYVSCYAQTLHRDVLRFEELGYKARSIRMYDFYANTPHTEAVVLLTARNM